MSLTLYKKKRNFKESPEPQGGENKSKKLSFVVQRHKATRLHYDFRLEMEGVLKSWAVPKGPSLNPQDRRLAMMVEDHPFDYKDFHGVIPSGYGAGIVEIWDKGSFYGVDEEGERIDEKSLLRALKKGSIKFALQGKKLKGEFALVKIKSDEKGNAWLLIKHRDKYAVDEEYDSETETTASSPINKWLKKNKPEQLKTKSSTKKAKKSSQPRKAKS